MEFHEKLQQLRKQNGLTQEELASVLYVSRTAVSKWESGRGYPNIDSLKRTAEFFSVTVDELLSGDQVLTIAEEDRTQKEMHAHDLVFGLLDLSCVMFFFLPFFAQKNDTVIHAISLLSLTGVTAHLRAVYFIVIVGMTLWGILTLALQNCGATIWLCSKRKASLLLNIAGTLLFIVSPQPYAAFVFFAFLLIKVALLIKKR